VPESTSNVEMAHKIHEHGHQHGDHGTRTEWIEIAEAIVLAFVAIATAWSGYQAALWDARSAEAYAHASAVNVQAQEKATLAGQNRLYDITTFQAWVDATLAGRKTLADFYERRFRPEYKVAFDAWIALDPIHNAETVVPGPTFMPEYRSELESQSAEMVSQATEYFHEGVSTRETGDQYVRLTVFLATVLLLTALSQRFKIRGPRVAILVLAGVLLVVCAFWLVTAPRI
jgi:hypothetical protein